MKRAEMAIRHFFMWIIAWIWDDDERLSADRGYDASVHRLQSKCCFGGTAGDMSYLHRWSEAAIWGSREAF